ncbi:mitochondrial import receptor subunit tom70-like [Cyprinus carpio]|uniref:Mitochondrial import receptor subunit tom70-like n=1 Tax=Cyprinus carpio TaxID=7962 RepID=A0A9R0BCJ8_CYPCA|nr:mitochondrial import receptor subunit tom70-like [Cyprinus carpio]
MIPDFETFATDPGGIPDIWDAWFDEVFLPLENIQSAGSLPDGLEENQVPQDEIQDLNRVVLDEGLNTTDLDHKVAKPTQTLTECRNHRAFKWCRRGALHIKLGCLNQALEDLNAAISPEPHLLDAYWHRHCIYLLRNDPDRALDDLNFIVKNNKKHADLHHHFYKD